MIYGIDEKGKLFSSFKNNNEIKLEVILSKNNKTKNILIKKEIIESLNTKNKRVLVFAKHLDDYILEEDYEYDIRFYHDANWQKGLDKNLTALEDISKKVFVYIDDIRFFKELVNKILKFLPLNNFLVISTPELSYIKGLNQSLITYTQFIILNASRKSIWQAKEVFIQPLNDNRLIDAVKQKIEDDENIYIVSPKQKNSYMKIKPNNYYQKEYQDYWKEKRFPDYKGPRVNN